MKKYELLSLCRILTIIYVKQTMYLGEYSAVDIP
jgi:hypothetical protein